MGIVKKFASEDYVQNELAKIGVSIIEPADNDMPKVFINGAN